MIPLFQEWSAFLKAHRVTEKPVLSFTDWLNQHNTPMRYYHTAHGHIVMVMGEFEPVRELCSEPLVVEGALFTHDVVYDSRRKDSEEKSAIWMSRCFGRLSIPQTYCEKVGHLIVDASTQHRGILGDTDRNIFISCDLAILGRPWEEYAVYMYNVAREYAWVDETYGVGTRAKNRATFLEAFLQRNPIFPHEYFYAKYETQAKENLRREIEILRSTKSAV